MKTLLATLSLAAVATTAATAAPTAHATPKPAATKSVANAKSACKVAPADEYFGRLKLSILGIRNTIKDQGLKVDVYPEKADSTLGAIGFAEEAMHDWQKKYPCDSWLPGSIYALEHFYTKIHTADGVKKVHATYAWFHHDFAKHKLHDVALKEDHDVEIAVTAPVAASSAAPAAVASPAPVASPSTK